MLTTFGGLRPGQLIACVAGPVVVRAVEPCGVITDVQFYDHDPDTWHTFATNDPVELAGGASYAPAQG